MLEFLKDGKYWLAVYNDIFICYTNAPKRELVEKYTHRRGFNSIKEFSEKQKYLLGDDE